MIYLIRTFRTVLGETIEEDYTIPVLKIGYTDDNRSASSRFNDYKASGLVYRLIKSVPGCDMTIEHRLHRVLKKYRIEEESSKLREWYQDKKEIYDLFEDCDNALKLIERIERLEDDLEISFSSGREFTAYRENCLLRYGKDSLQYQTLIDVTKQKTYQEQLSHLVDSLDKLSDEEKESILDILPPRLSDPYRVLGPEECKLFRRNNRGRFLRDCELVINEIEAAPKIAEIIKDSFKIGVKYKSSDLKRQLADIYKSNNYKRVAKASDIKKYFKTLRCNMLDDHGKWQSGFKLISKKE